MCLGYGLGFCSECQEHSAKEVLILLGIPQSPMADYNSHRQKETNSRHKHGATRNQVYLIPSSRALTIETMFAKFKILHLPAEGPRDV